MGNIETEEQTNNYSAKGTSVPFEQSSQDNYGVKDTSVPFEQSSQDNYGVKDTSVPFEQSSQDNYGVKDTSVPFEQSSQDNYGVKDTSVPFEQSSQDNYGVKDTSVPFEQSSQDTSGNKVAYSSFGQSPQDREKTITRVVNQKTYPGPFVDIGRTLYRFHYGNPFSYLPEGKSRASIQVNNREESISLFSDWLYGISYTDLEPERRAWIIANLRTLKNKALGCYCYPKSCHGDVFVQYLESDSYAGIGARNTPGDILELMSLYGDKNQRKLILHSGGADGADLAFEKYVSDSMKRIYTCNSDGRWEDGYILARKFVPHLDSLTPYVRKLFIRSMFQILGANLDRPVRYVLFWAPEKDGIIKGGTRAAVYLARSLNIPTFNLYFQDIREKMEKSVKYWPRR